MAEDDNADSGGDKARHLVLCHLDKPVEPGSRGFDLNSFLRSQSPCHSHSSRREEVKDHVAGVSRLHAPPRCSPRAQREKTPPFDVGMYGNEYQQQSVRFHDTRENRIIGLVR